MGAWEKFQLGWLNYEVAYAGKKSEHKLGPMETNTKQAQGLFVDPAEEGGRHATSAPPSPAPTSTTAARATTSNSFMYKSFNLAAGVDHSPPR